MFYELGDSGPHTWTAELDPAAFNDADRTAYFNRVKQVPYMKVKEDTDLSNDYMRTVYFKSNNNDDALWDGEFGFERYFYISYDYSHAELQGSPMGCRISTFWVAVHVL